ncbi:hypothetical protein NW064_02335 [Mycoplasmopsis felis]|nr:hypothetical protein [Mycoplasmopsis felis]UWW01218.1 hypothetical protein NW064_02335 [Mycoplasmopsis felis]
MNDIKSSKNAFYRTLDVVYKNSDKLLEHLRLMVEKELKEKTKNKRNLLWYIYYLFWNIHKKWNKTSWLFKRWKI